MNRSVGNKPIIHCMQYAMHPTIPCEAIIISMHQLACVLFCERYSTAGRGWSVVSARPFIMVGEVRGVINDARFSHYRL